MKVEKSANFPFEKLKSFQTNNQKTLKICRPVSIGEWRSGFTAQWEVGYFRKKFSKRNFRFTPLPTFDRNVKILGNKS